MYFGDKTYYYFLIMDGEVSLLQRSAERLALDDVCMPVLETEHRHAPNWEAVGVCASVVERTSHHHLHVYLPEEPLGPVKTDMYRSIQANLRQVYARNVPTTCVELPSHTDAHMVAYATFGRDASARWGLSPTSPVQRAVNAAKPQSLGLPGGPCHIIRDVEMERLPDKLKAELIEDIEKGRDLSNADADKIYKPQRIPAKKIDLFRSIFLTSHAQYRMNLRSVTTMELQSAFDEFERWYLARKRSDNLKPQDQKLLMDLAYGDPVRFSANRIGLTIVFAVDQRRKEARLVSCWWTDAPKTPRPTPGQCEFIPYLDRDRSFDRPAILGYTLERMAHLVDSLESREAKDRYIPLDEPYIIPDDPDVEDNYLDAYYEGPLNDPSALYQRGYEERLLYEPITPVPGYEDDMVGRDSSWEDDGEVDAARGKYRYYGPRPVNPNNRRKNRQRRRKYRQNPSYRRDKRRTQKRYERLPGTKRKRQLQRKRRKQRGRG